MLEEAQQGHREMGMSMLLPQTKSRTKSCNIIGNFLPISVSSTAVAGQL